MCASLSYSILVAVKTPVYRIGLVALLKSNQQPYKIAEVCSINACIYELKNKSYQLLFLDFNFSNSCTFDFINSLKQTQPNLKIILILNAINLMAVYKKSILNSGVNWVINNDADNYEIRSAVWEVLNGGSYYSQRIMELFSRHCSTIDISNSKYFEKIFLSIMFLIYHEKTSKEIGSILNLSTRTVEDYRLKIMRKTNSVSMVGVTKYVIENHIHTNEYLQLKFNKYCVFKNHIEIDYNR